MIASPEASTLAPTSLPFDQLATQLCASADAYRASPGDLEIWSTLSRQRLALARAVLSFPPSAKQGNECHGVIGVVEKLIQTGVLDHAVEPEEAALLASLNPRAWSHQLAAMILAPAWEWQAAPSLDDVATWVWPIFNRYLFHSPQSFTAVGQAERYAAHHLRRLKELDRWASANRGSSAVRQALETYLAHGNCIPLYFSTSSLKEHYELRARIVSAAMKLERQAELPPFPREGRRLRVGFVNRHFGSQTETYTTLPTFEQLDRERFEVILFAHHENGSELESYIRSKVSEFQVLPVELAAQVQTLQMANLDVVVFGTNMTAVPNEVMLLALHRVAPLQVVNNSSCTTTGLPEIDLYVSGDLTESADAPNHFTERLGLLPGPAHAFNYNADRQEASSGFTRESVGMTEEGVLFVSAANFYKIVPEMMHAWGRILAAVPGSKLLVHPFNPNWSNDYPIQRFCAEFDRVLAAEGVAPGSLIVSSAKFPSRTDVKELLSLGDLYLDTFPFGGVNSLIDPLETGVPAVVWEGQTFRSRMGAALLRQLGLPELIADSAAAYEQKVIELAKDVAKRQNLRERIQAAMEANPLFLDPLAASDAFGALLETAFDELVAVGQKAFRKDRRPLRAQSAPRDVQLEEAEAALESGLGEAAWGYVRPLLGVTPNDPHVRRIAGRALVLLGRADRGAQYLLESIHHSDGQVAHWVDLANALLQAGQWKNALEAVQVTLQLEPKNLEAILTLGEIAERTGQLDQIEEAVQTAQEVAPHDLRVMTLAMKVNEAIQQTKL